MEYLFLLADLKNRAVLVIGGGDIAARKVNVLKRAGAEIRIVAHTLCSELKKMVQMYDLKWCGTDFKSSMLNDIFFVVVATNDKSLNDYVYKSAERYCKFINVVDDQLKCSLIFPSIIDRSPVMVAISSSGKAPVLARMLREKLESLLPNFLGPMANLIGIWRKRVKCHISNSIHRRWFWEKILYNNVFNTLMAQGLLDKADSFLDNCLSRNDYNLDKSPIGSIALVGAGPGDSGLFTLRGLQVVQEADVVLYDYLVTEEILDLVRKDAQKICVGKKGRYQQMSMKQDKINRLLVKFAQAGNKVVRLKGGDPFIFGRGGEELEEAIRCGIPCQVIPGVTAASSVTIYAGIPLTHREFAHSVIFTTGYFFHSSYKDFDFRCLSYSRQTLVIYMGAMYASKIRTVLLCNGCDVNTPVAVISEGTCKGQKVSVGVLNDLEHVVNNVFSPSLLIIGKVVDFHRKMSWLNQKNIKKYEFTSLLNLF